MFAGLAGTARAEDPIKGEVKVQREAGYTRLVFRLDETVDANVRVSGAILVINFKRPVSVSVDRLSGQAPNDISAARSDPDGRAVRIALSHGVQDQFDSGRRAALCRSDAGELGRAVARACRRTWSTNWRRARASPNGN